MEQGHESFLQCGIQVDQQIPTTEQVEFGKRRVLDQILDRKNRHFANFLFDVKAIAFIEEKSPETLRRDMVGDGPGIDSLARRLDCLGVDVRAENLYGKMLL